MSTDDVRTRPGPGDLPVALIVHVARTRWKFILASSFVLAAAAGAWTIVRPGKFEATVSVATVGANRGTTLGQGISAAFLNATNAGLQATPALIGSLLSSNAIASAVARSHFPGGSRHLVGQLLNPGLDDHAGEAKLVRAVRKVSTVAIDRETGLISIAVSLPDSALARFVVGRFVDEATTLFRVASHAQARENRVALEARVDSARRQMTAAEDALSAFASSNRSNTPYSRPAVEEQRLERQVNIAQGVLVQSLQEREAAIGKELEETPVLVVVEPLPAELPPVSRGTLMWMVIGFVVGLVVASVWAFGTQWMAERRVVSGPVVARVAVS